MHSAGATHNYLHTPPKPQIFSLEIIPITCLNPQQLSTRTDIHLQTFKTLQIHHSILLHPHQQTPIPPLHNNKIHQLLTIGSNDHSRGVLVLGEDCLEGAENFEGGEVWGGVAFGGGCCEEEGGEEQEEEREEFH